jgi:hypothetical protein
VGPLRISRLQDDRPSPIAKYQGRLYVLRIGQAGGDFRPNDQHCAAHPGANQPGAGNDGVERAGAPGIQVIRRDVPQTQALLEQIRCSRRHLVGRRRGNQQAIHRRRRDTGVIKGGARRQQCQVRRGLFRRGHTPLVNARQPDNVFLSHPELCGQLPTRPTSRRDVTPYPADVHLGHSAFLIVFC